MSQFFKTLVFPGHAGKNKRTEAGQQVSSLTARQRVGRKPPGSPCCHSLGKCDLAGNCTFCSQHTHTHTRLNWKWQTSYFHKKTLRAFLTEMAQMTIFRKVNTRSLKTQSWEFLWHSFKGPWVFLRCFSLKSILGSPSNNVEIFRKYYPQVQSVPCHLFLLFSISFHGKNKRMWVVIFILIRDFKREAWGVFLQLWAERLHRTFLLSLLGWLSNNTSFRGTILYHITYILHGVLTPQNF